MIDFCKNKNYTHHVRKSRMAETILSIQGVTKRFGNCEILRNISLEVEKGEFITLLGASGCGKTTLLRIIAGLETPSTGSVFLRGKDITNVAPNKRNVNTVFQNYALFPHMSVIANVGYGLKVRGFDKKNIEEKARKYLSLVQLDSFERRYPANLSGGQKQRVALARALATEPDILLLDEPLAALDLKLRKQMQADLKRIQQTTGTTFIYVTHDQGEALNLSSRICLMNEGCFEQVDTPLAIYNKPESKYVADFIGDTNIISAVTELEFLKENELFARLITPAGTVINKYDASYKRYASLYISVRPETIYWNTDKSKLPDYGFQLDGKIVNHHFNGSFSRIDIETQNGFVFTASAVSGRNVIPPAGTDVYFTWSPVESVLVNEKKESRLQGGI